MYGVGGSGLWLLCVGGFAFCLAGGCICWLGAWCVLVLGFVSLVNSVGMCILCLLCVLIFGFQVLCWCLACVAVLSVWFEFAS